MNIMIDLETLDGIPSSVILSIGMAAYDDEKIVETFYDVPSAQEQLGMGRTVNIDTIRWWLGQSKEAQKVFDYQKPGVASHFAESMRKVAMFISRYPDAKIWGYGSDFDISILRDAIESLGIALPWKFNKVRCFRTWCDEHGKYKSSKSPDYKHHALEDAKDQAMHMIETLKREKEALALEIAHEGN